MNAHPRDHEGQAGTVYVLHLEPAYRHARHYISWATDVDARLAAHRAGTGSPLIRAALAAGVDVQLAATFPGTRRLERRLKRWHKTGQFCPKCRAAAAAGPADPLWREERYSRPRLVRSNRLTNPRKVI